jgi:porin
MLAEEHHFTFEFGYTLISQAATRTVDDSAHTLTSGSYDLSALWTPVHTEFGQGSIGFHLEGGHILDRDHNEDLSTNVGSILGIRDDLDNQEIALTELWWVWSINQTRIFTLGKIDPTAYFDANRIANDETTQFLATPLVNNLAAPFPDYGLGAVAEFHPADWFYINIGASDARANGGETGFNTVGEDWFYAGEFGFILDLDGHQGVYRFTVWGVDSDRGEDGTGFSLSFDQEVADHVVPFFRYGYGDVTDFRRSVSGGVGFEGLLGRADDLLAVGAVWADASDRALGAETLIEVFYRVQVAEWLQVTPDVQFVIDPAQGTGASVVFGLRVQAIF